MKLLITGGLGFIGSNFIRYWLTRHSRDSLTNLDAVTYAANPSNIKDLESSKNYTFTKCDVANEGGVQTIFTQVRPDLVIHFAAETHVDRSIKKATPFIRTNVEGTRVILETARWAKTPLLIHVSTDEIYGSVSEGETAEDAPFRPRSPYAASKAAADHLAQAYAITYKLPVIIARPSNNFGPYQFPEKFMPRLITNALKGKTLPLYGSGEHQRDWLFVEDTCRAIELLIEKGEPGEAYNIGASNHRANRTIARAISKRYGVPIEPVIDRPGHDLRYAVNWRKIAKLGFAPRPFEEALEETFHWYETNQDWWKPLKKRAEALYQDWGQWTSEP